MAAPFFARKVEKMESKNLGILGEFSAPQKFAPTKLLPQRALRSSVLRMPWDRLRQSSMIKSCLRWMPGGALTANFLIWLAGSQAQSI